MAGCRQIGQRIAAKNRRFARIDGQPQDNKLSRLEERKRLPIDWRQSEGSYAVAFLVNTRDSHLSKAGPCWRLFLIGESRIPHRSFGAQVLLEHCLERTLPTLAECGNPQRVLQLLAGMSWQIQEGVNVGHTDSLRTVGEFYDVFVRPNFSFLQHAKVEPWSVMCHEQGCHPRLVHADADAVARHAWLRYFKYGTTDAVSIANANLVIGKSLNREVFSELAESEIVAPQEMFPVMVRIHLVDEYGAVLPAVTGEIGLRITIDIELAHHSPPRNRRFPDCSSDSFAVPGHVARQTDIYRDQAGHAYLVEVQRLVRLPFLTSDEPERRHPRGESLRSHDLPVPGKERHRQYPLPSPFSQPAARLSRRDHCGPLVYPQRRGLPH